MIKTALIVDDEEALRDIIAEVLELESINSLQAADGQQAIELAKAQGNTIDCVFLDMNMPGLSGEETYHQLKPLLPNKPVIFMSGYDLHSAGANHLLSANNHYLKKPFTIMDIRDLIKKLV